jgi:tRNA threonylcarbamoyladenosine modification (KEOPS) complex  Pcc1 subunit
LINGEIEIKINENGLRKSEIQLQVQDTRVHIHVNQWQAEYNGFYRILAF